MSLTWLDQNCISPCRRESQTSLLVSVSPFICSNRTINTLTQCRITVSMCYYDNYKFACNDWKWGNFRQHCQREYRTGETCGTKLVFQTLPLAEKCTMCEKIERKQRRLAKTKADYQRWATDPAKYRFTLEKAVEEMKALVLEISVLVQDKDNRYKNVGNTRRA